MKHSQPEKDISLIKNLMEKSSKFSNLSGYAIATTGLLALLGAVFIYFDLGISISEKHISYAELINQTGNANSTYTKIKLLIIIASLILLSSLLILYVTAKLKSERQDINLFNSSFSRALKSLFVPVISGGVFCGFLIFYKMYGLVAPATLIFYGLGLISASKYSYNELELLGYIELILGTIASYYMGSGLLFWMIGFGIGHIVLGVFIHYKYDKK
ncbi:MAG: hypothetical protein CL832_07850 [Crocinitomicaceae bacterium]|nr:hypothetical protein [Crocinitomicaceae bacterium]|tara:strand:+ start:6554 stop:7201 length:648 start_codon:yes stop_codon:yes gene_type:complete